MSWQQSAIPSRAWLSRPHSPPCRWSTKASCDRAMFGTADDAPLIFVNVRRRQVHTLRPNVRPVPGRFTGSTGLEPTWRLR